MKRFLILFLLPFLALPVFAQDETGVSSSSELVLQASTMPEAKLGFTYNLNFPFLQGDNPLTEDNNIDLSLTAEVSPVSLNGLLDIVWTPIAFIEISAGARAGTGWALNLFGGDNYGIGLNLPGENDESEYSGNAFDALLWKVYLGGAFQFDLAALFPGDWNHIIFKTYHEINLHGNTRAKAGQAWYFENDDGENINGLNYYGNLLIGYQMPLFLNIVAVLVEADLYLYDTPGRSNWGDDMIRWTLSGILNFAITEQFNFTLIAQFESKRNYNESNWEDLYYRTRTIDTSNPLSLEFLRVAAVLSYSF